MRRFASSMLAATVLLAVIIGAASWWKTSRFLVKTNNAYIHSELTTVSSRLNGFISRILVSDNQRVVQGDLLAEIDKSEYEARRLLAVARLNSSQARIQNLQARKAFQLSLIEQAGAEVVSRSAELEGIVQSLDRLESLRAQDYAAEEKQDQQEIAKKAATAQLTKAKAHHEAQQKQLAVLESERQEMEARIRQDDAELVLAQIDLENTRIVAPVSGTVGKRNLRPGQFVKAATPLISIVPEEVWVEANFKETQIQYFRVGQRVTVEPDAFPGQNIESTIHSLAPATGARFSLLPPENATGNFTKIVQRVPVRINLPAGLPLVSRLVPGMSVVVTVDTQD